jgi:acetolactate synthase I/II/III large subunit
MPISCRGKKHYAFRFISGGPNVGTKARLKYGRTSGVDFGPIDYVKYAEAFGAKGLMIKSPDEIAPAIKKAFDMSGPVIVGVHVNYQDNHQLFEMVKGDSIH